MTKKREWIVEVRIKHYEELTQEEVETIFLNKLKKEFAEGRVEAK